jgi:hypothetical protein
VTRIPDRRPIRLATLSRHPFKRLVFSRLTARAHALLSLSLANDLHLEVPGSTPEAIMKKSSWKRALSGGAVLVAALGTSLASAAQEASPGQPPQQSQERPVISQDRIGASEDQGAKAADGRRHGLPLETYGVAPGTRFLVALEDDLGTKGTPERAKFKVKTLEPLEAGNGIYLPSGAEIEGHVSHVESAGTAGRARLWLTFDEIHTKFGRLPIVAEVISVPGDHSVKNKAGQEGLIEGRSSTQQDAAQAAAAGAALGAVKGVKDKDKKEAAEGAALGAITAYLMETGRGHELELPRGAKLELELERALYLVKE